MMAPGYEATVDELTKRILALIPSHPEIMTIESPFDLFGIAGFKCADLGPSLAQAGWALAKARHLHKANNGQNPTTHPIASDGKPATFLNEGQASPL